jgi:hypothetical protein
MKPSILSSRILFALVTILLFTIFCHKETDEDKVRGIITTVQHAAEEKKLLSVLEPISKAYRDPQGNDFDDIKTLMLNYFFRHKKIAVTIPSIDVAVSGQTARANFQAILSGRGGSEDANLGILPEALGLFNFDVQLRKEEGTWKVTSAMWTRVGNGAGQGQ